ncbi:YybH family protein [Bernardetia sp.]|uniref:YybH family protein n=1 Tax=Bernardetia sp. TaxID=1937974 RepID=UPI0025BD79B2|nr:nuclear transport factor 2 family protein [Bernardetia sp.]
MRQLFFLLCLLALTSTVFGQSVTQKEANEINKTFKNQEKAWNKGDLEGFMNSYWESDSLKFIGKNGITYGYNATLDRYKKSYPDTETMGKLSFDILSMEKLGKKHIFVVGKWYLKREAKEDVGGHFTLVWKKINGKWVIVSDHSS